jgi:hypothetical protein
LPALTNAQIKNFVRRAFREVVDPSPDRRAVAKIWAYFESQCCYCNRLLDQAAKEGHIDHLISAANGGPNQIGNRVLSCASCNEKEKLDQDWREFLVQKCPDPAERAARVARIEAWLRANEVVQDSGINELVAAAARMAEEVNQLIDEKYGALRALRTARRVPEAAPPEQWPAQQ